SFPKTELTSFSPSATAESPFTRSPLATHTLYLASSIIPTDVFKGTLRLVSVHCLEVTAMDLRGEALFSKSTEGSTPPTNSNRFLQLNNVRLSTAALDLLVG